MVSIRDLEKDRRQLTKELDAISEQSAFLNRRAAVLDQQIQEQCSHLEKYHETRASSIMDTLGVSRGTSYDKICMRCGTHLDSWDKRWS